jgi:FkbM family methyltransferase
LVMEAKKKLERRGVKSILLDMAAMAARLIPLPLKRALYHTGPMARFLRRTLNKAAPSGQAPIKIAGGDLEDLTMMLDLQKEKDYWLGTYEPELQAAIRRFTKPGMVVYDIGANIGYVSLLFARAVGPTGRVFAFEALPANLKRLQRNIDMNPGMAPIQTVAGAVCNASQPVRFLMHESTSMGKAAGSAGRPDSSYTEEFYVTGISLDDFIFSQGNPAPQVIKVDIEGGEVIAVSAMLRTMAEIQPIMLVELHGPQSAEAVCRALWQTGYRIARMRPGYPQVKSLEELDWKSYIVAEKQT